MSDALLPQPGGFEGLPRTTSNRPVPKAGVVTPHSNRPLLADETEVELCLVSLFASRISTLTASTPNASQPSRSRMSSMS
jgi:hypothetical protein